MNDQLNGIRAQIEALATAIVSSMLSLASGGNLWWAAATFTLIYLMAYKAAYKLYTAYHGSKS